MLLLISFLASTLHLYEEAQQRVRLEGGNLYSSEAVSLVIPPRDAANLVEEWGGDARAFLDLPEDDRTRVIFASDLDAVDFPVWRGRGFEDGDSGVALVGSRLPVSSRDGEEFYDLGGTSFRIIGGLGGREDSLLSVRAVVIDDQAFGETTPVKIVFDGDRVSEYLVGKYGKDKVKPVALGVAGRSNIDVVSPMLMRLGMASLLVGSLLVGAMIASFLADWATVRKILGARRGKIAQLATGWYLLLSSAALVLSLLIVCVGGTPSGLLHGLGLTASALAISLLSFLCMLLGSLFRKGSSWNY